MAHRSAAAPTPSPDGLGLATLLRARISGEVDVSTRRRAEYSSDASNYRVAPRVVTFPRTVDDVLATVETCKETGTPLTARGAGTSVAGNAVGPGVVMDLSRHLSGVAQIDAEAATATVLPGTVLDGLQRAAAAHGLRFGPDPSTHGRCTLGGMLGNNACGARSVAFGRTADNVLALDAVDGTGRRFTAGPGTTLPGVDGLVAAHLATLRTELGRFGRQVSGYALEHLLPERGRNLARALVGSEGTCVVVLGATLRLVPAPRDTALAVLGFPDLATAADAVPALLEGSPLAVEGMDARLVDAVRAHRGESAVPDLPAGGAWALVELAGSSPAEALAAARACAASAGGTVLTGPAAVALWRVREDGAGLAGRTPSGAPAWPGWEDSAVPADRLGGYLRDLRALLADHGLDGLAYGHLGEGCVHLRLDLPLQRRPSALRPFLVDAARLVAEHGGSLSGEHGDGRARSDLLPLMYSPDALAAFAGFKHLFDPAGVLNPGVLVDPRPVEADLRLPAARPLPRRHGFALADDGGDLATAAHRCVGVGRCRADISGAGGFMCPSYLATRDEKDSTRGRARVLQEMARGGPLVTGGWSAPEVHESLELCLSCKACASDCPAGVDMATYKSEVLHRTYRHRLRPRPHYALGWLPRWAVPARWAPGLASAVAGHPLAMRAAGLDPRRQAPAFARPVRLPRRADRDDGRPPVLLWTDTFTAAFAPGVAVAAARLLDAAGHRVLLPHRRACCGLTWIATGQLEGARRRLRRLVAVLDAYTSRGVIVVGLEPPCTAVLRSDLLDLLPGDPAAARVAAATRTLAEVLDAAARRGWRPPPLSAVEVVAQPHCHQHAVIGYAAERAVLAAAGATVREVAGCCGMAGGFGMERGHYEVSVAVARHGLLPALRAAGEGAVLLADGFSCRTQAQQLAGWTGHHLAELLADRLGVVSRPQAPPAAGPPPPAAAPARRPR